MAKKVAPKFKPAPTNHSKGDKGSFGNVGQKPGKKSMAGKEKLKNQDLGVQAKLRKISKAMFAKRANTSMHAQTNA